jgi:hypothetical protein
MEIISLFSQYLVGKDSIPKDWENFIVLREKPIDLMLNICDVRGNREIIYETGDGYTLLTDSSKWVFNKLTSHSMARN